VIEKSAQRSDEVLLVLGAVIIAGVVGAIVPSYVAAAGDSVFRLAVLPTAIALGFLFLLNRPLLFLLIIFFRAVCDPLFEATRASAGSMGLGAIANAIVILMACLFLVEGPKTVSRTAIPMWAPLLIVALVGTVRAPELGPAVKYLLVYLSYAAVFTIPFYLRDRHPGLRFFVQLILVSSVMSVMYGFVDFATGACGRPDGRICSTFEHPNIFAFYLVLMVSLTLYMLKSPLFRISNPQRWLLVAYMVALIALLLLTKTRSAWAACIVVFGIYGLFFQRRFLVYLAVGLGLLLLLPPVQDRLMDLAQGNEQVQFGRLNSYAWRKSIWEAGLRWMTAPYIPIGYGLESFAHYVSVFFPTGAGARAGAHSVYVQWFFEAGIIGVGCAAWLFYRLFSMLWRGHESDRLGTVLFVTIVIEYLVMSYSDNMLAYLSFNWYFWFLMGAVCAVRAGSRQAGPSEPSSSPKSAAEIGRSPFPRSGGAA
jgi:O-antigen ligase